MYCSNRPPGCCSFFIASSIAGNASYSVHPASVGSSGSKTPKFISKISPVFLGASNRRLPLFIFNGSRLRFNRWVFVFEPTLITLAWAFIRMSHALITYKIITRYLYWFIFAIIVDVIERVMCGLQNASLFPFQPVWNVFTGLSQAIIKSQSFWKWFFFSMWYLVQLFTYILTFSDAL